MQVCYPDSNKVLGIHSILGNCSEVTFVKEEIIAVLGITRAKARVIDDHDD